MTLSRTTPLRRFAAIRPSGKRKHRSRAMSAHMSRVAELGCIACLSMGYLTAPELHHPRENAGAGQKAPDSDVIPLCPAHHRGTEHPRVPSIHRDRLVFIERFGTEAELLAKVRALLTEEA